MNIKKANFEKLITINPQNQKFVDEFIKLVNFIKIENSVTNDPNIIKVNTFRISHLKKNLLAILKFKVPITSGSQLIGIPGFGKGTITRINEILIKGFLAEVKELDKLYAKLKQRNKIIDQLVNVIGIGKSIAADLIDKNGITSLEDLIIRVKTKTIDVNDKIKLGLKYVGKYETKIPRKIITKIYDKINQIILDCNSDLIINICGSYRRGLPQSSDIDILICDMNLLFKNDVDNSKTLKKIVECLKKQKIITDDITSDKVSTKYMGFCRYEKKNYRIDIRLVALESYYSALVYFTGPYELNTKMRSIAKKYGFKLNEYGLFKKNTSEPIILNSEKDLFNILQIEYLEPEERNNF
jgi:DNA polymerase/3'-5' exonuclease PolX